MRPISLLPGDRRTEETPAPAELAVRPRPRPAERGGLPQLVLAVIGIVGVTAIAVGAFGVSYAGGRQIALAAGVSHTMAGVYPMIIDAVLVVACVAALSLRGAGWWMQAYAWLSVLFLLAAIAVIEAAHAAGFSLSHKPAAAVLAALPWALFLLGFGLWLSMLRHQRAVVAAGPAARTDGSPWWPWTAATAPAEPVSLAAAPAEKSIPDVLPATAIEPEGAAVSHADAP